MIRKRVVAFTIICAIFALLTLAQASDFRRVKRTELGKADWSVKASPNLATSRPYYKTVERFAAALEKAITGDTSLEYGMEVCFAQFADLRHDGTLSLIYGLDVVDRPSPCEINIVDRTPSGFEMFEGRGEAFGVEQDFIGDPRPALIMVSTLATATQYCFASWPSIYTWTGANYTNVSDQYKDFYRRRLEDVRQTIPKLKPGKEINGRGVEDQECLIAEAAAFERFLGDSPDTGLDQAARLAHSADRREREFAVDLLGLIHTPATQPYLDALAKDPDAYVAKCAADVPPLSKPAWPLAPDTFKRVTE